jgi:A1 cistron-splicing factor AAR2
MQLTPEGAQYYYETGAFLIVSDLPEGSQVGIDGEDRITQRFDGYKMIPSGLHLFTHSSPAVSDSPTAVPIRHGIFRTLRSKETLVMKYSAKEECLLPNLSDAQTGEEIETVIDRDHLKTLDSTLGVYPLYKAKVWQKLLSCVIQEDINRVLGKSGRVDSLMESPGDEEIKTDEDRRETSSRDMTKMEFVQFNLKRSWQNNAVGEEVTRFAKDKSWLWRDVVARKFDSGKIYSGSQVSSGIDHQLYSEPSRLLAQLQLSFVIFFCVQNFAALLVFKRLLALSAQSQELFQKRLDKSSPSSTSIKHESVISFYVNLVDTLTTQLRILPDTFFTIDLAGTGMEDFWYNEIETLVRNYALHSGDGNVRIDEAVSSLRLLVDERYGWTLPDIRSLRNQAEDEDYLEEGDEAPLVVEI